MLRSNVVNLVSYFYPVGNTPAVSLTQDTTGEGKCDVLIIGCGDVRNVLFTCYSEGNNESISLDFTCCDHQAAVLARNILLYSLILDDAEDSVLWDVYYHLYIDKNTLHILQQQAEKLYQISTSIASWHNSKYGNWFRMCNQGSLSNIRELWGSYYDSGTNAYDATKCEKRIKIEMERVRHRNQGFVITGLMSASPAAAQSGTDLPFMFEHYWKTGTTTQEFKQVPKDWMANPMFLPLINDTSVLHYGTDPLLGFHLATAYIPLNSGSPMTPTQGLDSPGVVQAAQLQFHEWCRSFKHQSKRGLCLRFFFGDALSFCHTLQHREKTGQNSANLYRDPSHFELLELDGEDYLQPNTAPLTFNVIDTSNLVDHIGTINTLVAAAPLLKPLPSSVIYTHSLVKQESSREELANGIMCGDFATISALLGLVAAEYWTNASASSSMDDQISEMASRYASEDYTSSGQMRIRIFWRLLFPERDAYMKMHFDEGELSETIFQMYLKMFEHECVDKLLARLLSSINRSYDHYHRASFASLLSYLSKLIQVDWQQVIEKFLVLLEVEDVPLMTFNHIQELFVYLYLTQVHIVPALRSLPGNSLLNRPKGILSSWSDLPSVMCVTLKIPRSKLNFLTNKPLSEVGTPALHCILQSPPQQKKPWQNLFSALQFSFGEVSFSGTQDDDAFRVDISEDPCNWKGSSPMIVSFMAPTWILLQEPDFCVVKLGIQSTPQHAMTYMQSLRLELDIHKTTLGDVENVFLTKYFPNQRGYPSVCNFEWGRPRCPTSLAESDQQMKVNLDINTGALSTFTGRTSILSQHPKQLLIGGAEVKTRKISAWTWTVNIGGTYQLPDISFPVPVSGLRSKTRIARKSAYIEIVVFVSDRMERTITTPILFPMCILGNGPLVWGLPRIDLDLMPVIDVVEPRSLPWLIPHTSLMLSGRERRKRDEKKNALTHGDARIDFKDSLFSLFMHVSGCQGEQTSVFGLNNPDGGIDILIFVSCLRLDLSNRMVVLDAAVVILTDEIMAAAAATIHAVLKKRICTIKASSQELELWKENIPTFAERCRRWRHRASCEHLSKRKTPSCVKTEHNVTCSCGVGRISHDYLSSPHWKVLSKYATRVAISPSFFSPLVEKAYDPEIMIRNDCCNTCQRNKSVDGGKLKECGRCHHVRYCSIVCQKKDWKRHKVTCTTS